MQQQPPLPTFARWQRYLNTVKDRVHIDRGFFLSTWAVIKIYAYIAGLGVKRLMTRTPIAGTIAFYPHPAGPWYTIWMVVKLAGFKIESDYRKADYLFFFDDVTTSSLDQGPRGGAPDQTINGRVEDISKDHVGKVFEQIFGYSITIDPTTYSGPAICKSNENGTHDGMIIQCPLDQSAVQPDYAYQKLVDSTFNGETSEDLRISSVFGDIPVVFHKHKALEKRFGTEYLSTTLKAAREVFSGEEIDLLVAFCEEMGLDFGAVDVMRDKHDGRIYVVDVNKTCMPVLSLTTKNLIRALRLMEHSLMRSMGTNIKKRQSATAAVAQVNKKSAH